jgi:hypothetical protein
MHRVIELEYNLGAKPGVADLWVCTYSTLLAIAAKQ